MAALQNFPNLRPALLIDFAKSGRVDSRIAFTRATTATRWGPSGKLELVPAGVPRIDYDKTTGECLGLLLEEARTNLAYPSNMPTSTAAAVTGKMQANGAVQITSGVLAPDGSNKGFTVAGAVDTTNVNGANNVRILAAAEAAGTYAVSGWARSDNSASLFFRDASSSGMSSFTPTKSWQRFTAVFTTTQANSNQIIYTTSGAPVDLFGLQVEAGAFATSDIPTTTAAVARTVETATIGDITPWFNPAEGTILLGFKHINGSASDITLLCLDNGSGDQAEQHVIRTSGSGTTVRYTPRSQGANVVDLGFLGGVTLGSNVNAAISYGGGAFAGSGNGVAPVSLAAVLLPTGLTRLRFGQRGSDSSGRMTGHIRHFFAYAKRLTNEQQQRLAP